MPGQVNSNEVRSGQVRSGQMKTSCSIILAVLFLSLDLVEDDRRGVFCLHGTRSAHGHQLLHRLAGDRRHHGRHSRHAAGRLRRGQIPDLHQSQLHCEKLYILSSGFMHFCVFCDANYRSLRSADVLTCATIRTRTRLGDSNFSVAVQCLWNSLPVALRDRDISLVQFKRLLKTLWFVQGCGA